MSLTTQNCFATATSIIIIKDDPTPPGPIIPNGTILTVPVSAIINDIELSLYFETSIGNATITVTDDSNQVVYLETVNTDVTFERNSNHNGKCDS